MHRGVAYHDFMLASARDLRVRYRFQRLVCDFTPPHGTILDFGAGTGIDAKAYAARKFKVFVYEPDDENRAHLESYCRPELKKADVQYANISANGAAHTIAANFAVLNLVADHRAFFATCSRLLTPNGCVAVNLLNPFFVGDARYAWWRANLASLLRNGRYAVEGADGPIYRFTPAAVTRAAQPECSLAAFRPSWPELAISRYMFMVFRKNA